MSGADSEGDGRSVLVADVDDDGDDDLLIHNVQRRRFQLLRNEGAGTQGHGFLKLRLRAAGANTRGIGALVKLESGGRKTLRPQMAGEGFQSQRSAWMTLGLGTAKTAEVEIVWPGGRKQRFTGLAANNRYLLTEGKEQAQPVKAQPSRLPDPRPPGLRGVTAAIGQPVGPLPLKDLAGASQSWSPKAQRITVLHLWATWCKSCEKELGELDALWQAMATSHPDVDLLSLAMQPGATAPVKEFLSHRGLRLPSLVGDPEKLSALVSGDGMVVPTTLILDERGRLVEGLQGTRALAGIQAALQRLRPQPEAKGPSQLD